MQKFFIFLIILFLFLFFPSKIFAEVLINEFYPNPQTQEKEWVEFYNASSSSADLSNYVFDDDNDFYSDAESGAKIFLKGILAANSLCYWELDSYLNNNGDTPTLFKTDSKLVDTYSYKITQKGKSFSRVPDGGAWQENVEPSKTPINCLDLIPTPTLTSTPIPSPFFTLTLTPLQSPTPTLSPPHFLYLPLKILPPQKYLSQHLSLIKISIFLKFIQIRKQVKMSGWRFTMIMILLLT
jgi:hypothetical protein